MGGAGVEIKRQHHRHHDREQARVPGATATPLGICTVGGAGAGNDVNIATTALGICTSGGVSSAPAWARAPQ